MKEDTNNVVYAIIFLQGLACQFPWNALITATRYYDLKLTEWPTAKHFISHFAIIFMSLKFACMLASMTVGRAVDPGRRAFWSGLTMCTGVAVLLALSLLDTIPMTVFYGVTLAMVGVIALGSAWSEIAILEILAGMPPRLTQAYLAGQSVAGVVVCLHGLALLAWYGGMRETGEVQEFAIAYFGITMTVCGVALVLLTSLEHLPHFRYLEQRKKMSLINLHIKQEVTDNNEGKEKDTNDGLPVQDKSIGDKDKGTPSDVRIVAKRVWRETGASFILHVFNMFVLTALIVTILPSHLPPAFFCPLAFLSYNVGDLLAKSLIGIDSLTPKDAPILSLSIIRCLLVIPYLGTRIPTGMLPYAPFITSDWMFFALVVLTSLTGGYLSALAMMYGPGRAGEKLDRPTAVCIIWFSGMSGSVGGACLGLAARTYLINA